ncbi:MAG TPA: hypothetical protein VLL54_16495 [Pyrinomonadaceae bacterium]|nr:hypothetical protein [Pyrinomonadaceae bacterium]
MKASKIIFALFIAQALFSFAAQPIFSQTETLGIVKYTPPPGWAKTVKEGAVVYTDVNKTTNAFCVLTVYASSASAGSIRKDFVNEWNRAVVIPFKADANPKTQTQTNAEGWQATVGAAQIELEGGVKAAALLTVFSGFDKTTSILVIFSDESYLAQASALIEGIKLDKTKPSAQTAPRVQSNPSQTTQIDPFPDKPYVQPQKPLAGLLKESITMADLVGTWDNGGASVTTYVDSSSGNYSGTDTTFFTENYTIKPDGTFEHRFQGRTGNHTVREMDSGTVTLSGGYIIVKFTAGESRGTVYKYQFVAFMTLPNGGAVLSIIHIADNDPGYDANRLYWSCSHPQGFITCVSGDVWARRR